MWARTYFCASCGWKGCEKTDPGRCPACGSFTTRYVTGWDGLVSDLNKVFAFCAAFLLIAFIGTWVTYPYQIDGKNDFTAGFQMSSVSLVDSPKGTVARFSLRNDSRWKIARVELAVQIHAIAPGNQKGPIAVTGPQMLVVENLAPHAEEFLDVPVGDRKAGELFGWTARIESVRLPPGYWNKRLESALSPRLVGHRENIPEPFPQNSPIRQKGK